MTNKTKNRIKLIFLATPDIALESFKFFVYSPLYEVYALICQKPKPKDRGKKITQSNLAKFAQENNVEVFEVEKISKNKELISKLKSFNPDFLVTFAFGQILSQEVIDIARIATINLHASLLPLYRGANPICQAIADGCTKTGITTMKTVLELDAGDICLQEEIKITSEMNVVELQEQIALKSPALLDKTLRALYNNELKPKAQNHKLATFTKKITKEEKIIDWNNKAFNLHNKIRAMYQINTNHTTFKDKIIKVLKTKVVDCEEGACGEIIDIDKEGITVKCAKDALKLIKIKPEGKGEMSACDWARGARINIGDCFK